MQLAIGTKKVMFEAMAQREFKHYMDPAHVFCVDDYGGKGYLVEYLDGGPSNHPDHEHYISWSPKDVFDAAYEAVAGGMSFSHALVFLESGCKIARKSNPNVIYSIPENYIFETVGGNNLKLTETFTVTGVVAKDWVVVE